jgi:hypothetical protein
MRLFGRVQPICMQRPHSLQPAERHRKSGPMSRRGYVHHTLTLLQISNLLTTNQTNSALSEQWKTARPPDMAEDTFSSKIDSLSYTIHTCADCSLRASAGFVLVPSEIMCKVLSCKAESDCATSHPASTPEPPPAVLHTAQTDPPDHVCSSKQSASTSANIEDGTGSDGGSSSGQQSGVNNGQAAEHCLGVLFVTKSNRFYTGLRIILDVLVRVDHVVENGPRDIGGIQTSCGSECCMIRQKIDAQSREAHHGAPRESETQNSLRVVGNTFCKRICRHQKQRRCSIEEALDRELQQYGQPSEKLTACEDDGGLWRHSTTCDGSQSSTGNFRIQISVPEIIDGAACTAHDQCTSGEESRGGQNRGGGCDGGRQRSSKKRAEDTREE